MSEDHRVCEVDECDEPVRSRGMCRVHYMAWYHKNREPRAKAEHRTKVTPRRFV